MSSQCQPPPVDDRVEDAVLSNIANYCYYDMEDVRCVVCPVVQRACAAHPDVCDANPNKSVASGWPDLWNQDPAVIAKNCDALYKVQVGGYKPANVADTYVVFDADGNPTCNSSDLTPDNSLVTVFQPAWISPTSYTQFCGANDEQYGYPYQAHLQTMSADNQGYCNYKVLHGIITDGKNLLTADIAGPKLKPFAAHQPMPPCASGDPQDLCHGECLF